MEEWVTMFWFAFGAIVGYMFGYCWVLFGTNIQIIRTKNQTIIAFKSGAKVRVKHGKKDS